MSGPINSLEQLKRYFTQLGCERVIFKPLANNDNSKQQIYFGSDFQVLKIIPSGEIYQDGFSKKKGPIFKAPLKLFWLSADGKAEISPGAQLILYPRYPEVRMSGFLKGCSAAPSALMREPTEKQRADRREVARRVLFFGIKDESIYAYTSSWNSELSQEALEIIDSGIVNPVASVFYSLEYQYQDSKEKLLKKLKHIYSLGPVESHRLDKNGTLVRYSAQNGAGYTLEALFGIIPNGIAEPDFEDWELKSHSGSVVTLMTPEPNKGTYLTNLEQFLRAYGKVGIDRLDFASIHKNGVYNPKTKLTLKLEGYDRVKGKILDSEGGLMLRDSAGNLAAGWGFDKLLEHWKKKHAKTCYVTYKKINDPIPKYIFGPEVRLAEGVTLANFFNEIFDQSVYYDPGINMKFISGVWKPKKRNQFRVKWKDLSRLYVEVNDCSLELY